MTHSQNDPPHEEAGAGQPQAGMRVSIGVERRKDRKAPNLSRWFWGTIALLFMVTLVAKLLASWHAGRNDVEGADEGSPGGQSETKTTYVERAFTVAEEKAEGARREIGPLLDKAYAPVYRGIPAYMDYHYSLKGEWLELGSAALGEIGVGLDSYLFSGLETRLTALAVELDRDFDERYSIALDEALAKVPGGRAAMGSVVTRAIDDAKSRMEKTAGVFAAGALGGVSFKALTKGFAKNLGTKLAAKVAAKTGTKWVTVASGAGIGAGACSWAGPGAAGCAVVGAVITWVGVDLALVKLDEYVTRDEFERDLRELIDNQKEETYRALEAMLDGKALDADARRKEAVQKISLSELKDVDRLGACQAAQDILFSFDSIRENLQARSSANVKTLRWAIKEQAENPLLAPWVDGLEAVIGNSDFRPWVRNEITLTIDLPPELREEHEIRATLTLGQKPLEFEWTPGNSVGHFELKTLPRERILLDAQQHYELTLVQDRGLINWNRSFSGSARFDLFEGLANGSGLSPRAKISLAMLSGKSEELTPFVTLELPLAGVVLPKQEMPEFCSR
ncbi:hypothetical protein [Sedimentimonas flavescens]|uniref:hypothetical protein n=1 Tax=Sedimentimonas flavescens TaxID=2851012 RepID=UPI001C4A62FA|nr:hypothetical protein [Sedimentimonas flavescens]MBW0157608.1 hypothetical protein [Sedimentimonas flavescens]